MRQLIFGGAAVALLAGCGGGDPLAGMARLQDVTPSDQSAAVTAPAPAERTETGGLFSRLLNRAPADPTNAAVAAAMADVDTPETAGAAPAEAEIVPVVAPAPPRGLAGLFGGGGRDVPRSGPDRTDVTAGTVVPFGQIARVCDVRRSDLGTRIDDGGGFSVYDTNPSLITQRPFYITGFADDCARTFTAAVAVTGDIQTHEFVRYQPSNEGISYTTTDNAYEAIKASVCRVGRGQPCGSRAERLNRNTYFISAYGFFGGTFSAVPTEWAQILLHDGAVVAMSMKND